MLAGCGAIPSDSGVGVADVAGVLEDLAAAQPMSGDSEPAARPLGELGSAPAAAGELSAWIGLYSWKGSSGELPAYIIETDVRLRLQLGADAASAAAIAFADATSGPAGESAEAQEHGDARDIREFGEIDSGPLAGRRIELERKGGVTTALLIGGERFPRAAVELGTGTFRIDPVRPVAELQQLAGAAQPPAETVRRDTGASTPSSISASK